VAIAVAHDFGPFVDGTVQIELSRDDVAWVKIADPVSVFRAHTDIAFQEGPQRFHLFENALPLDLFTDPAGADDVDDVLFCRTEWDADVSSSGVYMYTILLLPSLKASQSTPRRGNVFSGNQY
jgi:hypothetical protein